MIVIVTPDDELLDPQALADQLATLGYAVTEIRERGKSSHFSTLWEIVDEVAVERALNCIRVDQPMNTTERREVIRRATERGLPLAPIYVAQGWQQGRYRYRAA